jgi:hypothetical protein
LHFVNLEKLNLLPSFEELEIIAKKLYDTYSTADGQYEALYNAEDGSSKWALNIPLGSPWVPPPDDKTSVFSALEIENAKRVAGREANLKAAAKKAKKAVSSSSKATAKKASDTPDLAFKGDRVLSETITFMTHASTTREVQLAATQGDVGRVWEGLKVSNLLLKLIQMFTTWYI